MANPMESSYTFEEKVNLEDLILPLDDSNSYEKYNEVLPEIKKDIHEAVYDQYSFYNMNFQKLEVQIQIFILSIFFFFFIFFFLNYGQNSVVFYVTRA